MSTEHILMALAAGGLTPSEKLLLIAYADHTDAHGYCWPSVQRLADITGLSRATVTRTNAALRKKGLIKSVRRVNPRTGLPISNLTRLNVRLLASMRRPVEKLDNLVEEITFDGDETPSDLQKDQPEQQADASGTPSDLLIAHHEPYIGLTMSPRQAHHEPQTSHGTSHGTSSPYPLADVQEPHTHRPQEEEEEGIPQTDHHGAPGGPQRAHAVEITLDDQHTPSDLPMCQSDTPAPAGGSRTSAATGDHGEAAAALVADLPTIAARAGRPLTRALRADETTRLAALVTAALARGWTADQIRAVLADDLRTARSPVATWHARLASLGAPPAPAAPAAPAAPPKCGQCNPFRWLEDDEGRPLGRCPTCHPSLAGSLAGRRSA